MTPASVTASRFATASTVTERPVSSSSEVVAESRMPHGTMCENQPRSVVTLKARPCEATQRETRTPIEANLRGAPPAQHHTPVSPSRRVAAVPNHAAVSMAAASSARR